MLVLAVFAPSLVLAWLAIRLLGASRAHGRLDQWFVVLMPLSLNATGVCLSNGQLIIHLLPAMLAGLILACDPRGTRGRDAVAAGLITLAIAKPSLAAPFWWIALFAPGRLRPATLVVLFYGFLTVGAAHFQQAGLIDLLRQ